MLPSATRYVFTLVVLVFGASACRSNTSESAGTAATADTWAAVNGKPITRQDVDKAYRRTRDANTTASEEETIMAKMSLLDDLIAQEILLAKAAELKVQLPQAELDTAEANAKKNIPLDVFQQQLTQRGLTEADMPEGLRRELLAQKVLTREVTDKITVSDQEITDFFNANRAQIIITPGADPQLQNGTGDDATRAAGGRAEGSDADGAPQGGRVVQRAGGRLLRGFGNGAARWRSGSGADFTPAAGAAAAAERRAGQGPAFCPKGGRGQKGPDEVEGDTATIGPFVEGLRGELGAVIDRDRPLGTGRRAARVHAAPGLREARGPASA